MIHSRETVYRRDRVTLAGVTYEADPVAIGELITATPNSGGAKYARLQLFDGRSFKWSAPLSDLTASASRDPAVEPRWEAE